MAISKTETFPEKSKMEIPKKPGLMNGSVSNDKKREEQSTETPTEIVELNMKHPLQHSWTLWYYKNDRSKSWEDNLREVVTFSTIEDFWAVYNHIELPSRLMTGCDYSIFKTDIKPMWEDEHNRNGGRWVLNLDKKQRNNLLDSAWLEVLLCLIGESFEEDGDIVNGAVVSLRHRGDKLCVWLGKSSVAMSILRIGRDLKSRLGLGPAVCLGFEAHEDTMNKSGSTAKSMYHV